MIDNFQIALCVLCIGGVVCGQSSADLRAALSGIDNDFGYVDIRPGAHTFWWLFKSTHQDGWANRPWVLWIQGGPGLSGTGMGNFDILGPLDINLNSRSTTWLQEVNLLFVDNPVGAGFSYVDSESDYSHDVDEIAQDLLAFMHEFLRTHKLFKTLPLFIFGQSYGGKMATVFSKVLYQAIDDGAIECTFKGYAMGNSWVSPLDFFKSYGPTLFGFSIIDSDGLARMQAAVDKIEEAEGQGIWQAFSDFITVEMEESDYIHVYNVMMFDYESKEYSNQTKRSMDSHFRDLRRQGRPGSSVPWQPLMDYSDYYNSGLSELMNGPVKDYLGVIPDDIKWGDRLYDVYSHQRDDFFTSVDHIVDELLQTTDLDVVVYQGQLDLICCTMGVQRWVNRMQWSGMDDYHKAERKSLVLPDSLHGEPAMFVKAHDRFKFYWAQKSGHSVPKDVGDAALMMLKRIITRQDK